MLFGFIGRVYTEERSALFNIKSLLNFNYVLQKHMSFLRNGFQIYLDFTTHLLLLRSKFNNTIFFLIFASIFYISLPSGEARRGFSSTMHSPPHNPNTFFCYSNYFLIELKIANQKHFYFQYPKRQSLW